MNLLIKYNPSSHKDFLKAILKLQNVKKNYLASSKSVDRNTCIVKAITKEEFTVLKNYWTEPSEDVFCSEAPCQCKACIYNRLIND